jgi:hypothetical protein
VIPLYVDILEPVGDFLVVKDLGIYEQKSSGGLFLPQDSSLLSRFLVIGVGGKVAERLGQALLPGHLILAHNNSWGFPVGNHKLMRWNDVYAIIRE